MKITRNIVIPALMYVCAASLQVVIAVPTKNPTLASVGTLFMIFLAIGSALESREKDRQPEISNEKAKDLLWLLGYMALELAALWLIESAFFFGF